MKKLSAKQLKKIKRIVSDHYELVLKITTGKGNPSKKLLRKLGLNPNDPSLLDIAFELGRIVQKVSKEEVEKLSPKELKHKVKIARLTKLEENTLEYAKENAGAYITALGDTTNKFLHTKFLARNRTITFAEYEREKYKETVTDAIENQYTRGKLKSELGHKIGDWKRDLERVAHTEMWNAKMNGEVTSILQGDSIYNGTTQGNQTLVFRRPSDDACKHCKDKFLDSSGKPIVFTLEYLINNGTNVGKKTSEWLPIVGCLHPNCVCPLSVLPPGFDLDSTGNMYFKGKDFVYPNVVRK